MGGRVMVSAALLAALHSRPGSGWQWTIWSSRSAKLQRRHAMSSEVVRDGWARHGVSCTACGTAQPPRQGLAVCDLVQQVCHARQEASYVPIV